MNKIKTIQVSEHAKTRIKERVENSGNEKPTSLFKKVMTCGKNISDFYGEYKDYLTNIYTKNGGKLKLKIYGSNIYLYNSTVTKHILITVLNTPSEFEPWKDYLCVNRNNKDTIMRLQEKKLKESEVIILDRVPRKEMLKWTDAQLCEWKQKAYSDREHSYLECKYCNRYLPCTDFSKDNSKTNRVGFRPECKDCYKAVKDYGGIKKMNADGITVFDLLNIKESQQPVETVLDKVDEPIRLKQSDIGLRDRIIRCRECDNDFVFNYGEQIYYKNHGYFDPSKCPQCREKAKAEKVKESAEIFNIDLDNTEQAKSNSTIVAEQAKTLLSMLRDNRLTLETFESILEVYKQSNDYVLELVRIFEDLVVDTHCKNCVESIETCKIGE